jgi:hypothetical protein
MHDRRKRGVEMNTSASQRDAYKSPALVVLGRVESLTQQQDKKFGPTDGFTFMGIAIANNSP